MRDDIREWVEGDHDEAEMYLTLMYLEAELSRHLRETEDPGMLEA